jgi:hypothetical protein
MGDTGIPFGWADVPGHVSYVLIAISYWLTNIYWLRVAAVVGLSLEIVYFQMSGGSLQAGIGWDVIFILINIYQIYRLMAEQNALKSMEEAHVLCQGAFAGLDGSHLARLIKTGTFRDFRTGTRITEEGKHVSELVLICDGDALVEVHGKDVAHLHGGAFVGEMAFLSGSPASATVTVEGPTRAFVFDLKKLGDLINADDLVAGVLHRVIGRDLARKLAIRS